MQALADFLTHGFASAQQWLFERIFQPLLFNLGLGNLLEDGYAATGWLLVGLLQIAVLALPNWWQPFLV